MKPTSDIPHRDLKSNSNPRDLRQGGWYWVNKTLIQNHSADIRAIGIAVYSCLAAMANKDQECFPSQQYIADTLGYSRTTISKTLKVLRERNLVAIQKRRGSSCFYRLLSQGCKDFSIGVSTGENRGVNQRNTNNNRLIRNNNNIVSVDKFSIPLTDSDDGVKRKTKEELLAQDIATGLEDYSHLPRYLSLANHYSEQILRQILSEAKQVPDRRIKKSRAALFNHLLNKYAQENNHSPGDQSRN